jgi:hypothetical protein
MGMINEVMKEAWQEAMEKWGWESLDEFFEKTL